MPDHIHMLVSIPPKMSMSSFMGYLKGKSALMIFERHANLKYKFGNRHFWSEGYYVSTVGLALRLKLSWIVLPTMPMKYSSKEMYPCENVMDKKLERDIS